MCWTALKPLKRVANRNIKVQKVLVYNSGFEQFNSPCYPFIWENGKIESCPVFDINAVTNSSHRILYYYIDKGFHSGKRIVRGKDCTMCIINGKRVTNLFYKIPDNFFICNFTIPKGATYYRNKNGEYVSDKIVFDGVSKNELVIWQGYIDKIKKSCRNIAKLTTFN